MICLVDGSARTARSIERELSATDDYLYMLLIDNNVLLLSDACWLMGEQRRRLCGQVKSADGHHGAKIAPHSGML